MNRRLIVPIVLVCQSLCASPGCVLTSTFLRDDSDSVSSFFARMNSAHAYEEWWQRYGEFFQSRHSVGHERGGLSQSFSFEGAVLREGRKGDLLRALRADLLEMAADSGASVHRPEGRRPAELRGDGFEFEYSQVRIKGKVRVEIKPAEKAGAVDVHCVINETGY